VARLLAAVAPQAGDTFLEIGPGRGALTVPLAPLVARLIGVEIDRDLANALPPRLPAHCTIVQGDFLEIDLQALLAPLALPVRVIGNLPYNVSSPILFALLGAADGGRVFSDATLMLQKEVADRLVAQPGSGDYGALAIQAGLTANIDRLLALPPGAFRPPPKVHSAVVRLRFHPPSHEVGSPETFSRIVRGVFLQRRKRLSNALQPVAATFGTSAAELIDRAGVDGTVRPEELSIADFARIARAVL
jgi:16S rRNA (adenine1518-N6/adenine1519-N6)-dimethyltransferase